MIDMVQNAKDLIAKGKLLKDPELIQMGMDLLEEYQPKYGDVKGTFADTKDTFDDLVTPEPEYWCQNCGHTMPVDKEGRKRCPECKKHKLQIREPIDIKIKVPDVIEEFDQAQAAPTNPNRVDMDQFRVQIRSPESGRIRYNENGEVDGIYTKTEQIEGVTNVWQDDGAEGNDPGNEQLKKFTQVSPRTRKAAKLVEAVCESCKKTERLHPLHTGARSRHLCGACIRKRSRV
jgi:hypothetical protein